MSHGTQNYWSSWASHIWYHVCFVFPVCTGFKKTVAGEEEMNVLKSIKYLYTAVITWFTWSVASFGNTCNHQEENTILCWNITYNRKMLLLHISLPFYKFSQRLIFHCAWMTDKHSVGSCCLPVYSSYIYFLMEWWNVKFHCLQRPKHFLDMFILE